MPVLGASGAIAGIIAAYAVRFPYAWVRVLVLIVFIPLFFSVPAMVFAGIWFFTQVLQGASELLSPFASSGIAWWAHIGGSSQAGLCSIGSSNPAARSSGTMADRGSSGDIGDKGGARRRVFL